MSVSSSQASPVAPAAPFRAPAADCDVAAAVRRNLRESPYYSVQRLSCEFRDGILTLRGRVPSFYVKQMAQAVVGRIDGVEEFDDRVEVDSSTSLDE